MTTVEDRTRADTSPEEFDPFAPAFLADPYPWFARFREQHPVFYTPKIDYWVLSCYRDVEAAFRDTAIYSAANALSPITPVCPHAQATLRDGGFRSVPCLTNADPPVHTRTRRIANLAFTPPGRPDGGLHPEHRRALRRGAPPGGARRRRPGPHLGAAGAGHLQGARRARRRRTPGEGGVRAAPAVHVRPRGRGGAGPGRRGHGGVLALLRGARLQPPRASA